VQSEKFHTMSVREHVRGGYREVKDSPTIVLNGGAIEGTWYPGTSGLSIAFLPGLRALGLTVDAAPARPVVRPGRRQPPPDLTRRAE